MEYVGGKSFSFDLILSSGEMFFFGWKYLRIWYGYQENQKLVIKNYLEFCLVFQSVFRKWKVFCLQAIWGWVDDPKRLVRNSPINITKKPLENQSNPLPNIMSSNKRKRDSNESQNPKPPKEPRIGGRPKVVMHLSWSHHPKIPVRILPRFRCTNLHD